MYPSYSDCDRGQRYTRKIGDSIVRMYKKDMVYVVSINGNSTGHMTYNAAIEHLIRLERIENVRRKEQGGAVRGLQGHGDTRRRGY
jgi:hypothetical protein